VGSVTSKVSHLGSSDSSVITKISIIKSSVAGRNCSDG
jgi:hypothetical protein